MVKQKATTKEEDLEEYSDNHIYIPINPAIWTIRISITYVWIE